MSQPPPLANLVETYRFWDIVTLWARERLEHEDIVARALARGIVRDGLKAQSTDPRWMRGNDQGIEFKGYPYVGFCARPGAAMCVLRAEALEHLLAVVHRAVPPERGKLAEEFIAREDFLAWLEANGLPRPSFWFGPAG